MKNLTAQKIQRRGAGMAAATRGRSRRFTDKKKQASKRACRGMGR